MYIASLCPNFINILYIYIMIALIFEKESFFLILSFSTFGVLVITKNLIWIGKNYYLQKESENQDVQT